MTGHPLVRAVRRFASLAFVRVTEPLFWLTGRREPYGILEIDVGGELIEGESEQRLMGLLRRPVEDYFGLVALLRWAREDPNLSAILIHGDGIQASWGRIQGLRRSILRLREAGKKVWFHLDGAGVHEYYLASAADKVFLTPAGNLDVVGLASEAVFFLGALEKLGIKADVVQMGRYKAAGEMFTRQGMSPEHREMVEALVDDLYGQVVEGVAEGRQLKAAAVRKLFDRGPLMGSEAKEAGLVDDLLYVDEATERLVSECGGATVIDREDYYKRRSREVLVEVLRKARGPLALLHITGTIKSGESLPGPEGMNATGAETVRQALKEIRERDDIGGAIVRVLSPGGSGLASDLIWREIARTREKKPVVVSLSDVAASGGYYVALAGSPVFAEPGTITGSIGVVAGKANLRGAYDKLGITKELVKRGRHAGMYSDYAPLGEEEQERIRSEAGKFYDRFVGLVAEARGIKPEAAAAAAEGRVWTGRQAWSRGLVDELGGFEEALEAVRRTLGIPEGEPLAIERFPRPTPLWKFPFDFLRPESRAFDFFSLLPHLRFVARERVWAILPYHLRFF